MIGSPSARSGLLLLLGTLSGVGCGGSEDPVDALLARLEDAVEARDAAAIGDELALDFTGRDGMTRESTVDLARRLLLGYEEASIEIYEVQKQPTGPGARVSCWVEFSGRARRLGGLAGLLPPGAVYSFELELIRGDPDWRVVSASWERRSESSGAMTGVSSDAEEGAR